MKKIHTHYDNLKVARSAPMEVIRAAYRVLAQKYHPDRNPGDTEAARIMMTINASYEVLSDSAKRREHDAWIAQEELLAQTTSVNCRTQHPSPESPVAQPKSTHQVEAVIESIQRAGTWQTDEIRQLITTLRGTFEWKGIWSEKCRVSVLGIEKEFPSIAELRQWVLSDLVVLVRG